MRLFFLGLILTLLMFFLSVVKGEDCTGDLSQRISCYESNLTKLGNSSKTLSSQISQFDVQIKLTTLKIAQTEEQISLLAGRIDQLEGSLGSLTKAYSERVVETYKMGRVGDPFFLLISSSNLNEAFSRYSYLKKIQEADRSLLDRLHKAQDTYKEEKLSQEDLQNQLENQQRQLNSQKLSKKLLLDQTKNDEKKYQSLLAQALAERTAIEKALVSGTKVGPIKAGDPIALVGNSGYPGCSTGKHLHFEVRKNGTWIDPTPYLSSRSVRNCQDYGCAYDEEPHYLSLGNGSWRWPIDDPVKMTQFYGHTPFSYRYLYSGKIHTGWDMVPGTSDVIRAPADGNLFKSSQPCGSSSIINIAYIEHNDGVITLYLHVQ